MSGWPTVRRHPRSLAEAWPREHACAVTVYRGNGRIRGVLLAIVIGIAFAFMLAACELRASVVSRPIRIVPVNPPAPCDPSSSPSLPAQAKGACKPAVWTFKDGRRTGDAAANTTPGARS